MSTVADRQDRIVAHISQPDFVEGTRSGSSLDKDTLMTFYPPLARAPRIVVRGRRSKWTIPVSSQLNKLISLGPNWDSYGAKPISTQRVVQAFDLLKSIMREQTPVPTIVPTNEGSLQLEWHTQGIDLEVLILGDNSYCVVFEDHKSGVEWERALSSDLSPLVEAVSRLSRPQ
jgi:hypothetical protein